jgi:CPA2 family monovalent cation:H+ antiporter-2
LFILAVLAVALGTALGAAEVFGVSLALGAFVAGVVVSGSPLSHQVGADVLPFREAFAVLFFVSVGMLVNPQYLLANYAPVLALTALVVIGKPLIVLLLGMVFPWRARTTLVVAAGLSQIGEFSFILGQAGVALGLLAPDQYSLILACALLSITLNPAAFRLTGPAQRLLRRSPALSRRLDRRGPESAAISETGASMANHVVIVGYGQVGRHIASLLGELEVPLLIIHDDAELVDELRREGISNLFGDAANSDVLTHAGLARSRALVVVGPEESANALVVAAARDLAPGLPVVARATTRDGVRRLAQLGAQYVIHYELEGNLEILRHTLLQLGYPVQDITRYTDAVRQDRYDLQVDSDQEHRMLRSLIDAMSSIEVTWMELPPGNPIVGRSLAEANLRARTGASVIAVLRNRQLIANPKSMMVFEAGDRIGMIGDREQLEAVLRLLSETGSEGEALSTVPHENASSSA